MPASTNVTINVSCPSEIKFSKVDVYYEDSAAGTQSFTKTYAELNPTTNSFSFVIENVWYFYQVTLSFYDDSNNIFYDESYRSSSITLGSDYEAARDAVYTSNSSSSGGLRTKFNPMGGFKKSQGGINLRWNSSPDKTLKSSPSSSTSPSAFYMVPIPIGIYYKITDSYWGQVASANYNVNTNTTSYSFSTTDSGGCGCYSSFSNQGIAFTISNDFYDDDEEPTITSRLITTSDFSNYTTITPTNACTDSKIAAFKRGIIGLGSNLSTRLNTNLSSIVATNSTIPSSESKYDIIYAGELGSLTDAILVSTSGGIYIVAVDKWGNFSSVNKGSNDVLYSLCKDGSQTSNAVYDCIACGPSGKFCTIKNITSSSLTTQSYTIDNSEDFTACCYGNNIYLAGTASGKLYASTDLENWELNHTFGYSICSIVYTCNKFLVMAKEYGYGLVLYISK